MDVLITTDRNLRHQPAIAERRLAILVLPTNDGFVIRSQAEAVAKVVASLRPGDFVELRWDD